VYLTDMADVLRRAGLKVVEIPGWKTRGRPGTFAPVGVLCHHTGSANTGLDKEYGYANWMATVGRSDLPAPLAQLALGRAGTFYVMAAGRANHAGRCKLIAGLKPSYSGATYGDGNAQLVGIEAMNNGTEGWSDAQYSAYTRGCAALNAAYRFPLSRTLGHKETSLSGKWDPGGINMTTFRGDVAAVDPTTQPPEDDDMPTLPEIASAVWGAQFGPADNRVSAGTMLARANGNAAAALEAATAAARDAAVARALAEEAAKRVDGPLTQAEIDAIGERVGAEFDDRFTVTVQPTTPEVSA
jgi:hypothetical protein